MAETLQREGKRRNQDGKRFRGALCLLSEGQSPPNTKASPTGLGFLDMMELASAVVCLSGTLLLQAAWRPAHSLAQSRWIRNIAAMIWERRSGAVFGSDFQAVEPRESTPAWRPGGLSARHGTQPQEPAHFGFELKTCLRTR